MNAEEYKAARKLRGTQAEVAALLGVRQATISDRENGGEITREAWLALNALPKKRRRLSPDAVGKTAAAELKANPGKPLPLPVANWLAEQAQGNHH